MHDTFSHNVTFMISVIGVRFGILRHYAAIVFVFQYLVEFYVERLDGVRGPSPRVGEMT